MRPKRRVPAPRRSHPAVWTAIYGRGAHLPLPKTPERVILRPQPPGIRGMSVTNPDLIDIPALPKARLCRSAPKTSPRRRLTGAANQERI
jgi:hypothetical protein